jgi:hypothetical protein
MRDPAILDQLLDPFVQCLDAESARRVIESGIAPEVQQRVSVLAEQANEGDLTEDDRTDYETLINATDLIAMLKLKAQRRLASTSIKRAF